MNTASSNLIIVGPSGSGKTLRAVQFLLSKVTMGTPVVILDTSSSYANIVRGLGGTVVNFDGAAWETTKYGGLPVTVYQLDSCKSQFEIAVLPGLSELIAGTLFVLDEAHLITRLLPDLHDVLLASLDRGGSFCLVGQTFDDVGGPELPADTGLLTLGTRHEVVDGFMALPDHLYRHQDGGIYRFCGLARNTNDPHQRLCVYMHMWPFEAGILWARDEKEWGSRFTLMTKAEVLHEMQQDRTAAQNAVSHAKEQRRAAAATIKAPAHV